ncbi:MAG: transposase, partial [Desulfamplus sp.]|nr:transposase [Desulfamplus sp.]
VVGKGFVVEKQISGCCGNAVEHQWTEQWMVTRSYAHAKRQEKSFDERMKKAEKKLSALKARKEESIDQFRIRAAKIVQDYKVEKYFRFEVKESITTSKKYLVKGRPHPDSPYEIVENRRFSLIFDRDEDAVDKFLLLSGWRVYVTNMRSDRMTLSQSTLYYRDEWLVERGFHRFKKGSIPVLPLFLRIPERIKGLMLLLTIALQVLTLIEFVSRKELSERQEKLSGLVPGNPKMKTDRPTAERLLAQFDNLHLLMEEKGKDISGVVVEGLTSLQKKILILLKLPETIYDLSFNYEINQEAIK